MRKFGIPVVMDRIVSQHMAIRHVQAIVREWYEWVVSIEGRIQGE